MGKKKSAREREVHLLVGTRKGGFLFRSDQRRRCWQITGPFFPGWEVNHLIRDRRSQKLYAAIGSAVKSAPIAATCPTRGLPSGDPKTAGAVGANSLVGCRNSTPTCTCSATLPPPIRATKRAYTWGQRAARSFIRETVATRGSCCTRNCRPYSRSKPTWFSSPKRTARKIGYSQPIGFRLDVVFRGP